MIKKRSNYHWMKFRNDLPIKAADDIAMRRVLAGMDKKTRPRTQIIEAISRGLLKEELDSFKALKKDLIRGSFPDDK